MSTPKPLQTYYALTGVLIVLMGGGSYLAGMKYQQKKDAKAPVANAQIPAFPEGVTGDTGTVPRTFGGAPGGMGARRGGGFVTGQIVSKTDSSLTVQAADGTTKTLGVSSATPVTKTVAGSITDLAVGDTITATGTAASDGSVQAQSIQVRPSARTDAAPASLQ